MEELPVELQLRLRAVAAIQRVADDAVVDVLHVHANLMRAASEQLAFHERVAVVAVSGFEALEHAEARQGLTCGNVA